MNFAQKLYCSCPFLFLFLTVDSSAQHEHENKDQVKMEADSMRMNSFFSPNLLMNRDGSGTSWQPDESPLWMHMIMKGKTSFMFNGTLFLRYTEQDITKEGERGGKHFDAPNMFMFMFSHKINKKNIFSVLTMFSLDPLTVGNGGYPLLFQTGESYKGVALVDRQHPHDLLSELALNYTYAWNKDIDLNAYIGYPGEPALGPPVFFHRVSAMNNPDAPLAHHWQDATHTSFGTATIGLRVKNLKTEGSFFTGREPNENRYDFDKPKFDSYSYRVSINTGKNFSFQFSHAFIKSPEDLYPDDDLRRITSSLIHTKQFAKTGTFISTSLIFGQNHHEYGRNLNAILLESNLQLHSMFYYFRYEFVQKDAHELLMHQFIGNPVFNVNAITFGLGKILLGKDPGSMSVGVQGTLNFTDNDLREIYGRYPLSAQVYLRFFPPSGHVHEH